MAYVSLIEISSGNMAFTKQTLLDKTNKFK